MNCEHLKYQSAAIKTTFWWLLVSTIHSTNSTINIQYYVIKLNLPQAIRILFTKKCRPTKLTVCPIKIENQIQVYKKKVKKFNFFIFYDWNLILKHPVIIQHMASDLKQLILVYIFCLLREVHFVQFLIKKFHTWFRYWQKKFYLHI